MLVAIGPCSTSSMTSTATTPPNTEVTSLAGSVDWLTLAMVAPRIASHTVGTNSPT
jgi:hypothetical protein